MAKTNAKKHLDDTPITNAGLKAHIYVTIDNLSEKKLFLNIILKDCLIENCYDNLSGYDYTLIASPSSMLELSQYLDNLQKMVPSLSYKAYILGDALK
ncbi:MAG: hypothetical protein II778_06395 [Anaerovibrio sp.]|nr:hypothetical protein [Anaerovibrio sp.]